MQHIGIDIGSTYTKYCVMNAEHKIIELFTEKTPVRQKEYFKGKREELNKKYHTNAIISCGYGRKNILAENENSELKALAKGINHQFPDTQKIILDIGGQDTKIIVQQSGKVVKFFLNEKCAAGSGMFLNHTLSTLEIRYEDVELDYKKDMVGLSSVCAVFAQSEIVALLAENVMPTDIINSVVRHVLIQARTLLEKTDCTEVILSGGFSNLKGIALFAENILDKKVIIPEYAHYLSAVGCCISG